MAIKIKFLFGKWEEDTEGLALTFAEWYTTHLGNMTYEEALKKFNECYIQGGYYDGKEIIEIKE